MLKFKKCHFIVLLIALICCGGFLGTFKKEAKASNYVYHCTDTDGENFYTKGGVNGHDPAMQTNEVYAYADKCNGENEVWEYVCDKGSEICSDLGCIARTVYQCPNGCNDGACSLEPKIGQRIGDADGDGEITKTDSDIVSKIEVGLISSPTDICAMDVDGNNKLDTFDALAISEIVAGNATSPGNCGGNPVVTMGPDTKFTKGNTYTIAFKITNATLNSKLTYQLNDPNGRLAGSGVSSRLSTPSSRFYLDRNNVLTFLMIFYPTSSWTTGEYKFSFAVETNGTSLVSNEVELEVLDYTPLCQTQSSASSLCKFELSLKKGWNFISLPINPENSSAEAVLASIKGKYSQVKTQTQSITVKSNGSTIGDLKQIYAKQGIEIKMNEDANFFVNGYPSAFPQLFLGDGWNWVGSGSLEKVKIKDFVNKNITSGYTFNNGISDADLQNENPNVFKQYQNDFTEFEPGKGYKLYTSTVLPDLIVESVEYYAPNVSTPKLGDYVGYNVVIKNNGKANLNGPFTVKAWLNGNTLRYETYSSSFVLKPGESIIDKQYSYTVFNKIGDNEIKITVDSDNKVAESDENNNIFTKTVMVSSSSCTETDSGKDYNKKGSVTGYNSYGGKINETATYADECDGNTNVMEFYCGYQNDPHNGDGYVTMENHKCPNGCKNGACVNTTASSKPDLTVESITLSPINPFDFEFTTITVKGKNIGTESVNGCDFGGTLNAQLGFDEVSSTTPCVKSHTTKINPGDSFYFIYKGYFTHSGSMKIYFSLSMDDEVNKNNNSSYRNFNTVTTSQQTSPKG